MMGNPPGAGKKFSGRSDLVQLEQGGIADFTYLDVLPISLSDVEKDRQLARGVLCDYCFFGGPTKAALRTDFPTVAVIGPPGSHAGP
jgi:hypothetical protein